MSLEILSFIMQGKLIEIHFSVTGKISGAKIQTCKITVLCKSIFERTHYEIINASFSLISSVKLTSLASPLFWTCQLAS